MKNDALLEKAKALKLYGIAAHWDEIKDDWIEQVITWEEQVRSTRSLKRRLDAAHLGTFKLLADFNWNWPKKCDRETIEDLMTLNFIKDGRNAIFCGPNGVGKSTLALNILHQAVIQGHTALFVTAGSMLNDLASQDGDNALRRRLKYYEKPSIICIDEVGYLSYSNRHADLLFEIISRRYEKKSTLVTTNRPFTEWREIFPNAACVVSLIDRLVHHCEIISIEGESYRLKEATEANNKRKKTRSRKSLKDTKDKEKTNA